MSAHSRSVTTLLLAFCVLGGGLLLNSPAALASSCVAVTAANLCATYDLSNVTLTTDTVNGNPAAWYGTPTGTMLGELNWEYAPGDFTNGSGTFTSLVIPWTYHGISDLILAIDNVSLSGTLPGNFHGQGVDFGIMLSPGLTDPALGSGINYGSSTFDIWGNDGSEYVGHVTAGTIIVAAVPLPGAFWLFNSGLLGLIGMGKRRDASSPAHA